METEDGTPGTERGLERLIFFSDAVVAIAITLLVLPLVDLVTSGDVTVHGEFTLSDVSDRLFSPLLSFVISFALIGRFWWINHQVLERARAYDGQLIRLTMLWLFTIVFLPFPAALSAQGDPGAGLGIPLLYMGTLIAATLTINLISLHVRRTPALLEPDEDGNPPVDTQTLGQHFVSTICAVIAFVLVLVIPHAGMYPAFAFVLMGPLTHLLGARHPNTTRTNA